jgi:hypothetical protein
MNYFNHIREYLEKNPSLQCVPVKDKAPFIPEWQSIEVNENVLDSWEESYLGLANGFGFRAGQHGIGYVDIDTDDPELINRIDQILDLSQICVKFGMKGKTVFFRFNKTPKKSKYNIKLNPLDKKAICEINFTVGQTVLPPSIHPQTGTPYKWISQSLLEVDIEDLSLIDEERIDYLETILRAPSFKEGLKNVPTSITGDGSGKFHTITKEAARLLHMGGDESSVARTLVGLDRRLFEGNQFFLSSKIGKDLVSKTDDVENATMWINTYKGNLMRQDPELRRTLTSTVATRPAMLTSDGWGATKPILKKRLTSDFDLDLIPPAFSDYIMAHSKASSLRPEAFLRAIFTTYSAINQTKVVIHGLNGFKVHPSVSCAIVAKSGSRKDCVFDAARAMIDMLIDNEINSLGRDFLQREYDIIEELKVLHKRKIKCMSEGGDYVPINMEIAQLQDELNNKREAKPDFIFESGTQEKLYRKAESNQETGLIIFSSEYMGLMGVMNRAGNEAMRGFFLKALNGSPSERFSHETIAGTNVNVKKCAAAALVSVQTDVFAKEYQKMSSGQLNDGLWQRFMLNNIEGDIIKMEDGVPEIPINDIYAKYAILYNDKNHKDIKLTPQAMEYYREYDYEIRKRAERERSVIASFKNKFAGGCLKHSYLYMQAHAEKGRIGKEITHQDVERAIRYLNHQEREIEVTMYNINYANITAISETCISVLRGSRIPVQKVYSELRNATRGYSTTDLDATLAVLEEHNYIKKVSDGYDTHPHI